MQKMRPSYPAHVLCQALTVSGSGYYAKKSRPLSKRAQEDRILEIDILAAHKRGREVCGPEKLQKDLAERGNKVGVCRIKRLRKQMGIKCSR